MRTSTKIIVTGALAVTTLLAPTAANADPASGRLVTVSHGDPFAGCTVGAAEGSVLYPAAEVEPSVATDPVRANRVVGAWQQDRWNDGGARGIGAGFSTDGGRTFHEVTWPVSTCARGLAYDRASD